MRPAFFVSHVFFSSQIPPAQAFFHLCSYNLFVPDSHHEQAISKNIKQIQCPHKCPSNPKNILRILVNKITFSILVNLNGIYLQFWGLKCYLCCNPFFRKKASLLHPNGLIPLHGAVCVLIFGSPIVSGKSM